MLYPTHAGAGGSEGQEEGAREEVRGDGGTGEEVRGDAGTGEEVRGDGGTGDGRDEVPGEGDGTNGEEEAAKEKLMKNQGFINYTEGEFFQRLAKTGIHTHTCYFVEVLRVS